MALSIESEQADRLAREVAKITGESLTEAVTKALEQRLERERWRSGRRASIARRLDDLARQCAALPDVDPRSPDEIIGYDGHGVPS